MRLRSWRNNFRHVLRCALRLRYWKVVTPRKQGTLGNCLTAVVLTALSIGGALSVSIPQLLAEAFVFIVSSAGYLHSNLLLLGYRTGCLHFITLQYREIRFFIQLELHADFSMNCRLLQDEQERLPREVHVEMRNRVLGQRLQVRLWTCCFQMYIPPTEDAVDPGLR